MDEYDDWSPLEETETTPHIDLRRRIHLCGRSYEVSACGGGHESVAVRLTGRNAGGFIVTDLRGDVLPHDLVDVAGLLQATLEGVATATRRDETWRSEMGPDIADWPRSWPPKPLDLPPNAGAKWTVEDLAKLVERHRAGATIKELMAEFGRTDGGIRSRLQLLGESLSTQLARAPQGEDAAGDDWAASAADSALDAEAVAIDDRAGAAVGAGPIDDQAERERFVVEADFDDAGGFGLPGDRRRVMESVA